MDATSGQRAFASQQGFAIISHENYQRVLIQTTLLKYLHESSESRIQVTDVGEKTSIIQTNFRQIGPIWRQYQFGRIDAIMIRPQRAMGLIESKVKKPWLSLGNGVQNITERLPDLGELFTSGGRMTDESIETGFEGLTPHPQLDQGFIHVG